MIVLFCIQLAHTFSLFAQNIYDDDKAKNNQRHDMSFIYYIISDDVMSIVWLEASSINEQTNKMC